MTDLGASGIVDDAILRISTTYDDLGRVRAVSSYSDPDPGEGAVVNQIEYVYNGWGRLAREYQEHQGAVDANTPYVEYNYLSPRPLGEGQGEGSHPVKYVRLANVVYPNGRAVGCDYAAGVDEVMSRLSAIFDDTDGDGVFDQGEAVLSAYKYLGAGGQVPSPFGRGAGGEGGRIVEEDYADVAVKLSYLDANGNPTGLDRFGRVLDQIWTDYGANPDAILDHYSYAYDRAGNRIARLNNLNHDLDETYEYDSLDRLSAWYLDGVLQKSWAQLDGLGNDLATGSYNAANEMTPNVGSSGYDAAGNMTTLRTGMTAVYDAWNRMTKVTTGSGESLTIVQQNEYDGANRRIRIFSDFDGETPQKVQDDYHRGQQVIESRLGEDGQPTGGHQYLWSPRYIDSPILRDTLDSGGEIITAERILYMADANYNVTGLVKYNSGESAWRVVERYSYAPYGVATFRDASWTAYAGPNPQSLFSNTTLYTGRTWDALISLYYYRARFYDAVLERFIGRDPIGYGADINLYRYCGNNPVIYVDPKGLERTPPPACKCCCALDLKINQLKDISKTGLSGRADIHALVSFIIKLTWVDAPKSAGGADCRLEWYEYTTHEDVTRKGYETGKWNNAIDYATKHPGTILDPWIRGDRTYGSPEEFPPFNDKPGVQGATGQATGTVYIAIRLRSAKGCVCDNPDPKPLLIQVDIDAQGDPPTKPKLLGTMPNPPGDPPFEP